MILFFHTNKPIAWAQYAPQRSSPSTPGSSNACIQVVLTFFFVSTLAILILCSFVPIQSNNPCLTSFFRPSFFASFHLSDSDLNCNPNPVMPISVKATFAQEGVFFAGERLNCTITFTNSGSPTSSNGTANGQGTHPRPPSTLQQKLLHHHQEQQQHLHQQNQHNQQHEANGANGKNQHRDNPNAASPTSPSSISPVTSPSSSPSNTEARTLARPGASQVQNVGTPAPANENGNRPRRPSHGPLRAPSQARLSSDISHIDAMPRGSDVNSKSQTSVDQDDQTDQDDDTASVIVPLPRNYEDNDSETPSSPSRQHSQGVSRQEEAQQSAASPGLLGLATFVYRSASFSTLASAFGLSGGEPEPESERLYGNVHGFFDGPK